MRCLFPVRSSDGWLEYKPKSIRWCSCREEKEGALACTLTSIKIVISNQSAHWPTIQNITHGIAAGPRSATRLFAEPGERRQSGQNSTAGFVLTVQCCLHICGCCAHIGVMSRRVIPKSVVPAPLPIVVSFHVSPPQRKKGSLVHVDWENKPILGLIRLLLSRKHASRRVCHQTHLQSFRLPHTTSVIPPSFIGLFCKMRKRCSWFCNFNASCWFCFFSSPIFSSLAAHRWGRSKPAHWGTQIFMQPPLHHHKPVVTKSQTPLLLGAELD